MLLRVSPATLSFFFFFNDTATTEIYTLSLHDALPISSSRPDPLPCRPGVPCRGRPLRPVRSRRRRHASFLFLHDDLREVGERSEEHTSELQSHLNLVCRLLLEKKKHVVKDLKHPHVLI